MKITIAALLHDIGKFYQRSEKNLGNNALYQQYIKNNGYIHGAFTAKFFEECINSSLPDFNEVLHESAGHHTSNYSFIKTADIIASGHDRRDGNEDLFFEETENAETANYVSKRMNTIFNEVNINGLSNKIERYELSLNKYTDIEGRKQTIVLDKDSARKEYKDLYDKFKAEIDKMNKKGYKDYTELHHLIYPIIKEYTVCIPGSTYNLDVPTVSLFDHLKLTTAIANCLKQTKENDYCFVDYDLSGIQKFIYKIAEGRESKPNVAKFLRTRSFYLNVLSDFIAYYIVDKFNLTYENVLYSSGGRGRVLIPYKENVEEELRKIVCDIEKTMFSLHNGEISFSVAYTKVNGNELCYMALDDIINDGINIISDKTKKFLSVINDDEFTPVSDPSENFCSMCFNKKENNGEYCPFCNKLLLVNQEVLSEDKFIIEYDYNNCMDSNNLSIKIGDLGLIIFHSVSKFKLERKDSYYMSFNCYEIGESKKYAKSNVGTKSFEDIAKINTGDKKLAVLKMDVDNLGYIFLNGIKKDKESISKNLTLSRMVDYFFTKKLTEICNREKYLKSVYINYAGGDDLVIILPASLSLEMIKDINNEFNEYTGYNKSFHISAGIEIFSPSSPVRYAIEKAEDFLSESKLNDGKSSFTVLDVTLKNDLLDQLINDVEIYEKGLNDNSLSRSGLYEIYSFIINALSSDNSDVYFMRFIPLIAYSIKRNMNDYWQNKLKNIFVVQDIKIDTLKYYKVVFAYALMKTRSEVK